MWRGVVASCGCGCARSGPRTSRNAEVALRDCSLDYGKESHMADATVTRQQLIDRLNEDLSREYQAIIAYVVYSQVLKGPEYMNIAKELETHATQELSHAMK